MQAFNTKLYRAMITSRVIPRAKWDHEQLHFAPITNFEKEEHSKRNEDSLLFWLCFQ